MIAHRWPLPGHINCFNAPAAQPPRPPHDGLRVPRGPTIMRAVSERSRDQYAAELLRSSAPRSKLKEVPEGEGRKESPRLPRGNS